MKLGDKVGIVCDHTLAEEARALRGLLESFRLDVDLHRLTQRWQAEEFFSKRAAAYDFLILQCHGCEKPCLQIKIEVIEPKKSNPELGDMAVYQLTPENIPDKLKGFKGVFVSGACESGRPEMGTAFLKAGCKAYLGPSDYSDGSSGTMFIASFFYFLQYEWRLPDAQRWSISEAYEAARNLDPRAKFGTKIWKLYEHK
jgi:hypothetical protein